MAAKRKRVTLNEFRAWLEGVEELQVKGWTPSAAQWALIRAKIDNITIPKPVEHPQPIQVAAPMMQAPHTNEQPLPPGMVPPPVMGGVPSGQVTMSPEATAMMTTTPGGKSVTPNIDTADGNYQSNFN